MERKHTVLFVDDEENILHALRRLFRREGYHILTATSGPEGLELVRENEVSLVISDQRMPQMIGAEFLGHVRDLAPHAVRIMLTGYSDIEAATQAINEGGVYRYITKPWDDEELKITVREALERFELEQRNRELAAELQQKNTQLEEFNARLEQKVEERTRELRASYEENLALTRELQMKVRELEGRDRITQHLLKIHTLEETLELVLQVIADIMELERAVIYLKREEGGFRPAAAIGAFKAASTAAPGQLDRIDTTPLHHQTFERVQKSLQPVNVKDPQDHSTPPFAVVPVRRGDELLGLIEASKPRDHQPVADEEVQALSSFALQAAVAISDAQARQNFGEWQGELDDILDNVEELDQLIS